MLRHFLNATARTSTRPLFAKPNPHFSGGHLFSSIARTSSRSLFAKCNTPSLASYSLRSNVHTNSRPLLVKRNAPIYVSSRGFLYWLEGTKYHTPVRVLGWLVSGLIYAFVACAWPFILSHLHEDYRCFSLEEVDEVTSKSVLQYLSYMGEYTDANREFKEVKGSGMPQHTFFWEKLHVELHAMQKETNELLVDCKRDGIRVEESKNFCFVIPTSESERARVAERIGKLRDKRAQKRKDAAWPFPAFSLDTTRADK